MAWQQVGGALLDAATELVRVALQEEPEGLSNQEVGERTGLQVEMAEQRGWISWTLLHRLIEAGEVEKEGPIYRLVRT